MSHQKYNRILLGIVVIVIVKSCMAQTDRKKLSRADPQCPNTCTLKRRIGKIDTRLRREVAQAAATCKNVVDDLRDEIYHSPNFRFSNRSDILGVDLRAAILKDVSEDLAAASRNISREISSHCDALNMTLWQVIKERDGDNANRFSSQRDHFIGAIKAMNRTIRELQSQNGILTRLSQETRAQNAVLRARSDTINDELGRLRRLGQKQQIWAADQDRIIDVEEKISSQSTEISSLQSKLEWLSSRVEQLSENVDAAKSEASSASDKAIRAADQARKAIAIARQRKPDLGVVEEDSQDGIRQPREPPNDCWELYQMGYNVSGVYRIRPRSSSRSFDVYCEQSYAGGGWTVIQRRRDGSVNFDRDWNAYADGFGNPNGEMWLGNEKIYHLTNQDDHALQVLLLDWEGNRAYAEYDSFRIHGNPDNYALQFGSYTRGNAGDGLRGTLRDGSRNAYLAHFTTENIDNDLCHPCVASNEGNTFYNCAELQGGGWWFRACSDSNLNGRYILPQNFSSCNNDICYGIQWRTWREEPAYSLKATIMLLRRNEHREDA